MKSSSLSRIIVETILLYKKILDNMHNVFIAFLINAKVTYVASRKEKIIISIDIFKKKIRRNYG